MDGMLRRRGDDSNKSAGAWLKDHRSFYEGLRYAFETETHFFCHAGVRPGVSLDRQDRSDLVEIRFPFLLSPVDHGKIVVHGHTISPEPGILPNRIGIDAGAAAPDGLLTAIELPSGRIIQAL